MNEYDRVGSSTEGTKKSSVCVTPHQSVFNPPLHNNKQDYKYGTIDKTIDYHTPDSDVSRHYDDCLKRNIDEENKNAEDDKCIDNPPIKMIKLIFVHMKISEKYYF